ncbi:MAG: Ig-like domain-containing protein, partial [Bdellovibrio sp.]
MRQTRTYIFNLLSLSLFSLALISCGRGQISDLTQLASEKVSVSGIEVTSSASQVPTQTIVTYEAVVTFDDNTHRDITADVQWESSDPSIAAFGEPGVLPNQVKALAPGQVYIKAHYQDYSISLPLVVTAAQLQRITVAPQTISIPAGLSQQLVATGQYDDGSTANLTQSVTWTSANTSVAQVSNAAGQKGVLSSVTPGTTIITATLGAFSGQTGVSVTSASLTNLTVSPVNPTVAKGLSVQFSALATYSDNSTQDVTSSVNWSSSNLTAATIGNSGNSKGLAQTLSATSGNAVIVATLGNVSAQTTLTITSAQLQSMQISPLNASVASGLTQQYTAIGTYSDGSIRDITANVNWSTAQSQVANISNAPSTPGLLTAGNVGSTTVQASLGSVSAQTSCVVTAPVINSLVVTPSAPSIPLGTSQQLTATATLSNGNTADVTNQVSWSSSDSTVATVNAGLVSSVNTGAATITANAGSASQQVQVAVTQPQLSSIQISPANATVAPGLTQQMTAVGVYTDGSQSNITNNVTWSSSNPSVATVNSAGLISALGQGSTVITATQGSTSQQIALNVGPAALASIQITPNTAAITQGLTQQFTATGLYTDGSQAVLTNSATWSSSNSAVASVNNAGSKGLATGQGTGSATISASYQGVSGSAAVTVGAVQLLAIAVTPATSSIALGTTQAFIATGTYSDNSTADITSSVTWSSSNTAAATVSNNAGSKGLATSQAAGNTVISATQGAVSGQSNLTVTPPTLL